MKGEKVKIMVISTDHKISLNSELVLEMYKTRELEVPGTHFLVLKQDVNDGGV